MEGEEDGENKNEIDRNTHQKDRESEWKESTRRSEWLIPDQENHQKDVDTHTDNRTECCLENAMQGHEIVEGYHADEHKPKYENVEFCHLECRRKSREKRHSE